jgi:hypothetical protein
MPDGEANVVGEAFLSQSRKRLHRCLEKIRHCADQLEDQQIWWRPHESQNSIANLILHLCGNLRQWIVAGAGGAADIRNRPQEFAERGPLTKGELMSRLAAAIADADAALSSTAAPRLLEPRRIQGFDETVLSGIYDSVAHLAGHTQEIVYVTRLQLGDRYRFHWTPSE